MVCVVVGARVRGTRSRELGEDRGGIEDNLLLVLRC